VRIHPLRSIEPINALLEVTKNPYHRQLLENFREHLTAEVLGDLDRLMATMGPHPIYHRYSGVGTTRDDTDLDQAYLIVDGREQNRALYQAAIDSGRNVLELATQRLAVSDWGIAGDGYIYSTNRGVDLVSQGIPGIDADATYIAASRFAYFLPYVDGLMAGEDTYRSPARYIRLAPEDVVTTVQ
jgi:hypothetical protein